MAKQSSTEAKHRTVKALFNAKGSSIEIYFSKIANLARCAFPKNVTLD